MRTVDSESCGSVSLLQVEDVVCSRAGHHLVAVRRILPSSLRLSAVMSSRHAPSRAELDGKGRGFRGFGASLDGLGVVCVRVCARLCVCSGYVAGLSCLPHSTIALCRQPVCSCQDSVGGALTASNLVCVSVCALFSRLAVFPLHPLVAVLMVSIHPASCLARRRCPA